jgi:SAM-dependent methyltransferase
MSMSVRKNVDELYRQQLNLIAEHSDQHIKIYKFIKQQLMTVLRKTDAFLDIGPGPGHTTALLSRHFKYTGIVEPDMTYCANVFAKVLMPGKKRLTVYNAFWPDIDLMQQTYDLILCSHVLYHVPKEKWSAFIKQARSCLSPGGKAVFILLSDKGDCGKKLGKISKNIHNRNKNFSRFYSEDLTECLKSMGQTYESSSIEWKIEAPLDCFLETIAFFMRLDNIKILQNEISSIDFYFKTKDQYQLKNFSQAIIIDG